MQLASPELLGACTALPALSTQISEFFGVSPGLFFVVFQPIDPGPAEASLATRKQLLHEEYLDVLGVLRGSFFAFHLSYAAPP